MAFLPNDTQKALGNSYWEEKESPLAFQEQFSKNAKITTTEKKPLKKRDMSVNNNAVLDSGGNYLYVKVIAAYKEEIHFLVH